MTPMGTSRTRAVLFDLDGTLADSAPDLAAALNRMRDEQGLPHIAESATRPLTSSGARGLLKAGFGMDRTEPHYEEYKSRVLDYYSASLCVHTRLFPGTETLLAALESRGLPWGIVTNKASRFAVPLVAQLGLATRAACVVSGDTTAHAKPHPAPLLYAAAAINMAPGDCLYVGDDLRDVQAARAAGMRSVAVNYGYLGDGEGPAQWGADALIDLPEELLVHL